jgi:DNA-binding NtrC family response regulator
MAVPVEVLSPEENPAASRIKALLLDDSAFDRTRIRRLSNKTAHRVYLTQVDTIAALQGAVEREVFDLILIDYRLPQGNGLDVLAHIQQSALNHDVATIMITGTGDMDTAVTAMRNGCHDFLTKEAMTADQLSRAMQGAIQAAAAHRDLVAQTAHQREVIRQGLTAALMDTRVQGTVVSLFKDQFEQLAHANSNGLAARDHSALEAFLATMGEDDAFIFN